MKIESNAPQSTPLSATDASQTCGNAQLAPEELKSIHEHLSGGDEIPHEDDETAVDTELSHEEVKSHTDNALEDEANSSLYQGQHLPK